MTLVVEALSADGSVRWRREGEALLHGDGEAVARALGMELGAQVRQEAGDRLQVI